MKAFSKKAYDSTIFYWKKAHEVALQNGENIMAAKSLNNIGIGYSKLGDQENSLLSYEKALNIYREVGNDTLLAGTLINIGQAYSPYDKRRSAELLYEAIAILERLENKSPLLINAYNTLGYIEQNRMAYTNAIELHEKALAMARQIKSYKIGFTYQNLSSDFLEMGNIDSALIYFQKTMRVKDSLVSMDIAANREVTLYSFGRAYLQDRQFAKAKEYFTSAGKIYREDQNTAQMGYVDVRLAELELQQNHYAVAFNHINDAANYVAGSDDPELQREYLHVRFEYYKATGQWESAAALLPDILIMEDRILDMESQKQMIAMEVRYDVDQMGQTIKGQKETIRNNQLIIILAITIALLLAALGVFIYVNYRQADRNRLIEQKAKEREIRQKIEVRQLHEEMYHRVKNNLATFASILELELKRYNTNETREALRDQKNRLTAINAIHSKLYLAQNRDNNIALNLKTYLTDLADQVLYSFGYNNTVDLYNDIDRLDIDMDRALLMGLLVNEALTNAFKYAVPDNPEPKIFVRLQKIPSGEWQLEVKDNGSFISRESPKNGESLGMKIFKNLTRQLNAKWHMNDKAGVHHSWVFMP
ncbi:MAG: tetratricopeptide repeat protein [Cyclobacteriaceae bacterium]